MGKHSGIDSKAVFGQILRNDFDPERIEALDLVFGERQRGGGNKQVVSIIDLRDGRKADAYPVISRFQPTPGRQIRCYVFFREKKVDVRGKKESRITGYAIPINIRDADRHGEWLGIGNNILKGLKFRPNRDGDGYYAHGPNGKVVIVAKDAGFDPSTQPKANYMVSEQINCYVAHCVVPDEELALGEDDSPAMVLQAETMTGVILEGVDTFGFKFAGKFQDSCEILKLPATATEREVMARYKQLAITEHPDAKANEFRTLTGSEPTAQDLQSWNFDFALIQAAKDRMLVVRQREAMRKQHLVNGRTADPEMPNQLSVGQLAKRLGRNRAFTRTALERIGYPGVVAKTTIGQLIAWVATGYANSGALDDLSTEEEPAILPPGNGEAKLDLAVLKLAFLKGFHFNGRPAAEIVAELQANGELPQDWLEEAPTTE